MIMTEVIYLAIGLIIGWLISLVTMGKLCKFYQKDAEFWFEKYKESESDYDDLCQNIKVIGSTHE